MQSKPVLISPGIDLCQCDNPGLIKQLNRSIQITYVVQLWILSRGVLHPIYTLPLRLRHTLVSAGDISWPVHEAGRDYLLEENLPPF